MRTLNEFANTARRWFALLFCVAMATTASQAQAGKGMHKAPDFLVTAKSQYGFDDTVSMIKGAIEQNNLMVVHEIDGQKMLRMVGEKTKGMKQVLFFHPRFMKAIKGANPNGAIEAPMKILVMEKPDGTVMVRYAKPTYLFGRYGGLDDIGSELESIIEKIVAEVR
ncbi:DUF302 domain-containing protein [Pelagicoccus enzymogenes]|uniref:DUF302 domain-containing protein n=1 Tax=Pelagicoccus enzymogenes TaxID=2773457 RepID=UPI00280FA935|nr:DUF302 domain-containing protein [Pelagicoccus enzymogenes]MDQ8198222.1 DUF302 domain-containing protein [Pelagicoccus enzymogenes]